MSTQRLALGSFALVVSFLAGCSAPVESEAESADDAVTTTPLGHYVLGAAGAGNDGNWLNEINLHRDGTFDGDFGNGLSNLSGHYFLANGTYKITHSSAGSLITFSYELGEAGTVSYRFELQAHGLRLQPTDDASEPWFTMDAARAPVTLTFAADGSVSAAAALHAGDTALLRYAASRSKCSGKGARVSMFASIDSPQPSFVSSPDAVAGYYDLLVDVGDGKQLDVWFEDGNDSGCSKWDSNASHNFVFAIAP